MRYISLFILLLGVFGLNTGFSAANGTITVDVTQKRVIAGHEQLDRRNFFGVYHETGYGEWRIIDGKNIDEWIYEEGDMLPSRGTVRYDKYWDNGGYVDYEEDPFRPGYIDPDQLLAHGAPTGRYVYAEQHHPDHLTILSGSGHGQWPDFMCWPPSQTHNVKTVKNYAAHAEAVTLVFEGLAQNSALIPAWYEVTNESDIQNNWGWHWNTGAWDSLALMHNAVADSMHKYWPEVKVCGATDAHPFRDDDDGSFSSWKTGNKRLIELSGDKLDCYSFHPYEGDVYEKDGIKTTYEAQYKGKYTIWTKGRLEAFLDLYENEHFIRWGTLKPFVISEYGLLGLANGDSWSDPVKSGRKYFSYIRTCNGMLMAVLDRPDLIDKFSAFIMSQAPYDLSNGLVFARSDDNGATYKKTRFFDWLRFWKDLNGEWLHSASDNHHIICRSFLENEKMLRVVLHNNYKEPQTVSIDLKVPEGTTILNQQQKMLYLDGTDFIYQTFTDIADLSSITIPAEATAMIKIELQNLGERSVGFERNYYGDQTLQSITRNQEQVFKVHIADEAAYISSAVLHLSLYKTTGFSYNPEFIKVNGVDLEVPDITFTDGVARCWKQFEINVPESILQKGWNTVAVKFAKSGGKITSVRLAVVQTDDVALAVDGQQTGTVEEFKLAQNYPNPFNPATSIGYSLPAPANVSVVIYNSAGQRVKTLFQGAQGAGRYELCWDGYDNAGQPAASGVYFYTLQIDENSKTRKMLLVR